MQAHERGIESDFVLSLLLNILRIRSKGMNENGVPPLKIIVMSATIQTDRFSSYISRSISSSAEGSGDPVPILHITGQLYPIHGFYLEDIKSSMRELAALSGPHVDRDEDDSPTSGGIQSQRKFDGVPYRLMISLILRLSAETAHSGDSSQMTSRITGSVLVFLPGIAEIFHFISLFEHLSPKFFPNSSKRFLLLPLHGSLSNTDQGAVFDTPPSGVIKIVVATNIAEASITIPDVTVVMDSCLVKEMSINPISKAMPIRYLLTTYRRTHVAVLALLWIGFKRQPSSKNGTSRSSL
jgi:HrpA-like RNA helicase